ncbi:AlwI family type II restriction endonuclease [Ureibacillus sp. MALMAid1270]|uniref:AlwI family type II restriction endonuclease n=1 Tax=Ureibacillus sp. MALMAid1270 TaxID=3411629 RepID=UPI003BA5F9CB
MPGTWSISTTMRNPERIADALHALAVFEGKNFNTKTQSEFFKEMIRKKYYQPTTISQKYKEMYEEPEEFTQEELEDILSQVHYTNKSYNDDQELCYALRGRTAVSNVTKMGLAIAKESMGAVQITELGKQLVNEKVDLSVVFFRYFLKWQLPNPSDSGYNDFDIVPFIATLHVVKKVNDQWSKMGNKPVGISKEEFSLFVTTLIDYRDIDQCVSSIIQFREEKRSLDKNAAHEYVDRRFKQTVVEIYSLDSKDEKAIQKKVNNLFDYGDSATRYFRMTGLLYYRGDGRYIDLAPTRAVEIQRILDSFSGQALDFKSVDDYLLYMSDINKPALPWENVSDLKEVYGNLVEQAKELQTKLLKEHPQHILHTFHFENAETIETFNSVHEYQKKISEIRDVIKTLKNDLLIIQERNLSNLDVYIEELTKLATRKRSNSGQDPLNLEYYVTMALMALDDAKEINPNYSVGDDHMPLFTAPGNTPDIECYYDSFNMICEVTLLKSRDQWENEGQPVMRHLRSFEEENANEDCYCLFIAPIMHRDTINTFWMSVRYEYEGAPQKIVPMTIQEFVQVLENVKELNNKGIRINHRDIKDLLHKIYAQSQLSGVNSSNWLNQNDQLIEDWKLSLING